MKDNLKTNVPDEAQSPAFLVGAVMLRNFMRTSSNIVNIEGGRTAYIQSYFEFKSHFKKSKSTYYRWIKQLSIEDEKFWLDKKASTLLFYYAT